MPTHATLAHQPKSSIHALQSNGTLALQPTATLANQFNATLALQSSAILASQSSAILANQLNAPDTSGTSASANGSFKFGTPNAADGRINAEDHEWPKADST